MQCKKVNEIFKVVGVKGKGFYANFENEVPKLAQQLQSRIDEVENYTGTEIALFEPKRGEDHLEGHYFVGALVEEAPTAIPVGMDYVETVQTYVMTRGKIHQIGQLHHHLLQWADEQGYIRDLDSHIVETYHPLGNGEEDVEIYLPIYN